MALPSRAALALAVVALGGGPAWAAPRGAKAPGFDIAPPDHPALRERFDFHGTVLRVQRHGQQRQGPVEAPLRRLLSDHRVVGPAVRTVQDLFASAKSLAGSDEATSRFPLGIFPNSLSDQFENTEALGQGSFAITFLATEKRTGKKVAVKVLTKGSDMLNVHWLMPADATSSAYKQLVDMSKEECIKAQRIHDNERVDEEGGEHVVRCIEDGITEGLNDPARANMPLFIVMDYVGKNGMDWWVDDVLHAGETLTMERKVALLRKVSRDMMKGLRFLTHEDAPLKWVHHDLKPPNMAVDTNRSESKDPVLTIIDLGTTVSNATSPKEKLICTPIYQPPEFAGPANAVGYSLPIHSFDTSSAALSILGLAGSPSDGGKAMGYPVWYHYLIQIGALKAVQIDTLRNVADCISELNGYRRDNFDKWMSAYEECLHTEGIDKYVGIEIQETLDKIRNVSSRDRRLIALSRLIACNMGDRTQMPADEMFTKTVVDQWMDTDFDKVILSMLELDPAKRPTPAEVLQAKWLQESYVPREIPNLPPVPLCFNIPTLEEQIQPFIQKNIVKPVWLIAGSGIFAFGGCCMGTCCRCIGKVPSAAFTALVAAMFVVCTSLATALWLSNTWVMLLECVALVLGPALVITGCRAATSDADSSTKKAWSTSLIAAGVFNMLIFCAIRWVSGPTVDMLTFISDNHQQFWDAHETVNVGIKPQQAQVQQALGAVWLTFFPPWGGLVTVAFGLWRENVHSRRTRGIARAAPSGTEMAAANAGSAAAAVGAMDAATGAEVLASIA